MKYLLPAFILLALSQTACVHNQAGNRNNSSSSSLNLNMSNISDTIAPENFLVPADVMSKFKDIPMDTKKKFCTANRRSKNVFYNTKPIDRIKGYNSRMDNLKSVTGGVASGMFARSASVMLTSLWALEDDFNKELAFNNLHKWAKADAWGKTRRCQSNGTCGTYWARSDGQDPYPGHDDSQSAMYALQIAYAYYITFADYYPADDRHITIKKWIDKWVKTRNRQFDGFGLQMGWRLPAIFANARQENANSAGAEIPQSLLNKIEKAGTVFVNGFKDPHTMHKWAKKKYNSQYAGSGDIIFKDSLNKVTGKSWLYTFMYRFPDSTVSREIAELLEGGEKLAVRDGYIGFGLGCIYGSLTYDPAKAKVVEIKVENILNEYQQDDRQNFTSYIIQLADANKLNVMVDWDGDSLSQVRLKIKSYELGINDERAILVCNKGGTVIRNGKLIAIKVWLGELAFSNNCVFDGLTDKTVEKLETLIHSSHAIFSKSKIIPEIITDYVKLN